MDPPKTKDSILAPQPPLHQTDADEDDQNVKQLQECSKLYISLQDCLAENDRNWKKCQHEVQALKACHERRMLAKGGEKNKNTSF